MFSCIRILPDGGFYCNQGPEPVLGPYRTRTKKIEKFSTANFWEIYNLGPWISDCNIGRRKDDTFVSVVISCVQNSVQTVFRVFIHVKTWQLFPCFQWISMKSKKKSMYMLIFWCRHLELEVQLTLEPNEFSAQMTRDDSLEVFEKKGNRSGERISEMNHLPDRLIRCLYPYWPDYSNLLATYLLSRFGKEVN